MRSFPIVKLRQTGGKSLALSKALGKESRGKESGKESRGKERGKESRGKERGKESRGKERKPSPLRFMRSFPIVKLRQTGGKSLALSKALGKESRGKESGKESRGKERGKESRGKERKPSPLRFMGSFPIVKLKQTGDKSLGFRV